MVELYITDGGIIPKTEIQHKALGWGKESNLKIEAVWGDLKKQVYLL